MIMKSRGFTDIEYNNGMLVLPTACFHCGNKFEIEAEALDGLITLEKCCSAFIRQNLITYKIRNYQISRFEVSDPDGDY